MKNIELKKVGAVSAFKTTLYIASIPIAVMAVIGVIVSIVGAALGDASMLAMAIPFVVMPFIMLGIYGLFSMLMAVLYNFMAGKFGGLELVVTEKNTHPIYEDKTFTY
ncbi:hypothetical protein [Paenibacillus sp. sgz500958]|uniref:hypothetical protein n=1 Tax=Paenibacillus sp. sgz500958 TaxID=3242475 RepID=UPI0036D2B833